MEYLSKVNPSSLIDIESYWYVVEGSRVSKSATATTTTDSEFSTFAPNAELSVQFALARRTVAALVFVTRARVGP
jgi:hypothetical protein